MSDSSVAITGRGIVCSIAHTAEAFSAALREGRCGISRLPVPEGEAQAFEPAVRVGGVIRDFSWREFLDSLKESHPLFHKRARKVLNNTTDSTRLSACAALQAFLEADLGDGSQPLDDVGLIVAGSNLCHDYVAENRRSFEQNGRLNARYALSFFDSNQVGCLSEILGLRGMGFTLGAASASGNAALFNACQWIGHGLLERCLVVGASAGFSPMELEAFATLGAACSGKFADDPARACRPFDAEHEGFVWGQGSAAVLLESPRAARARGAAVFGEIAGSSLVLDGNHLPDPSLEGEIRAMNAALASAGLTPGSIGYVNAHGSSSPLGDRTECQAIRTVFHGSLGRVAVNSTKSLTGHCMSAGGVVELIASLAQLNGGFLHPNLNLDRPIDPDLKFAGCRAEPYEVEYALSNAFGFGGINSTLVLRNTK